MGLEESRPSVSNENFPGCSRSCADSGYSAKPVPRRCLPWTAVHQCCLRDWTTGLYDGLNFDQPGVTCSSRLYSECSPGFCVHQQSLIPISKKQPTAMQGPGPVAAFTARPIKRVKFSKMAQHLEYNHIPASLSSIQKFRVKSVLCHRGSLMLLHLVRNMSSQFGIVDLRANKFLGIFAQQPLELPVETVRAEIAPDEARCLLLMPSIRHRPQRLDVLMLCDLHAKEVLSEVLLPGGGSNSFCQFAFDPRFTCYRVAVTAGSHLVGEPDEAPQTQPHRGLPNASQSLLSLLDCRCNTWRRLHSGPLAGSGLRPRQLQYSRAGHLLLTVVVDDSAVGVGADIVGNRANAADFGRCRCAGDLRRQPLACQLVLLDSDRLTRLRRISYFRMACPLHSCPTGYSPIMSRCGSRLALAVSRPSGGTDVIVRQLPQPQTLRAMAREVVLQMWSDCALSQHLALPNSLMNYLRFGPEFSCGGACLILGPDAKCGCKEARYELKVD